MEATLPKEAKDKLIALIQKIENEPYAFDFKDPVDYKGLGLTDYPDIVKRPMDLSTIKHKIEEGKYIVTQEVLDDIQLIWDNCKLYNRSDSEIYKMAESLENTTKKAILKLRIEIKKPDDSMF